MLGGVCQQWRDPAIPGVPANKEAGDWLCIGGVEDMGGFTLLPPNCCKAIKNVGQRL